MTTNLHALRLTKAVSCVPVPGHARAFPPARTRGLAERLTATAVAITELLFEWQERENQRRHLMTLDDHLLSDIGISRADAEREFRKPF